MLNSYFFSIITIRIIIYKIFNQLIQIKFFFSLYKSVVERDWAYICRREYNYDVLLRSWAYGFFGGNLAFSLRIFIAKKMVFWPLLVVTPIVAMYYQPQFLQKHNKKLFDMCNVGEQYFLGT